MRSALRSVDSNGAIDSNERESKSQSREANVQELIFVILPVVMSVGRWAKFVVVDSRNSEVGRKCFQKVFVWELVSGNFTSEIFNHVITSTLIEPQCQHPELQRQLGQRT